ncbi:MAG: PEP-CTERM sorting domain-containing protein [Chthoniobacteraceae bacterium]
MRKSLICTLVSSSLVAATASAATYTSKGTAGETLATAEVVSGSGSLSSISGSLTISNNLSTGNLFEIYISDTSAFSASTAMTQLGVNNFDTELFLFTATGVAVEMNDDTSTTSQSLLPSSSAILSSLSAGIYYLLIEGAGRTPVDSSGTSLFATGSDPSAVYGANSSAGALAAITGNSSYGGSYSIVLTGAQFVVPEPSTTLMLLAGLGAGALRRKNPRRIG